jgi:PIN domain nuclease of toxin-antitoxin system
MPIADLLLDTHTFIWSAIDDPKLTAPARARFLDPDRKLVLSVASIWEMAIKHSLGKLELDDGLESFVVTQLRTNSIRVLDITRPHAIAVGSMPFHHRDPFDRLIAGQALYEDMELLSVDDVFDAYGVRRVWS